MAINFPDSPVVNDEFTVGNRTWIWDGTVWGATPDASVDVLAFDTTAAATAGLGELTWNAADETLDIGLNSEVTLQVGQEQLIRAKNVTGVDIPNGTVVQFSGAQGDFITVAPAVGDGSVDHHYMVGVTTQTILDTEFGFVTTQGLVRGLNTNAYTPGTILYLDPAVPGGMTPTEPSAPNLKLPLAAVTKQGPGGSGQILVRVGSGEELAHLHDVQLTSAVSGEVLQYDGTKWVNAEAKAPLLATLVTDATTARTLTASDANKTILFTSGSAVTLTINASTDFPVGSKVDIVQDGAGVLTVTASGATVAAAEVSTTTGSFTIGLQYSAASIICVATDTYRLIGNIAVV